MLLKTPVVSLIAVLSLSLGIAAATAMFALVSAWWLEPLPFGDQDGLVLIRELRHGETAEMSANASVPNFRDWRDGASTVSAMAALGIRRSNVTGGDFPEEIQVAVGTPNLLEVLRIQPAEGRGFRPEEGAPGTGNVVVITDQYRDRRFDEGADVLGRPLTLDGVQYTIVGVMPEGFEMLPAGVHAFRPSDLLEEEDRGAKGWLVFGRLRPGATVEQVRGQLVAIGQRLEEQYPDENRGWGVLIQNARKWFPGPTDTKMILLLVAVSLFGVAIACANVANLLLSRAEARMKEVAVRTALGAGKGRIVRQLLTESIILGLAGGAVGAWLSVYVIRGTQAAMPTELPQAFLPELDLPTLLATVAVAMTAGILFGLAPAMHASKGNLREALGEGSRGGTAGRARKRLRNAFVVGQVAVALALLVGAAELRLAMAALAFGEDGIRSEGLLTFQLTLPEYKYPEPSDRLRFDEELLRSLEETAGVESVAMMAALPRSRENVTSLFEIEGREVEDPNQRPRTNWQSVSLDYFATLEIPQISGRLFEVTDRDDASLVVVVNEDFARRHLPDEEIMGKQIVILDEPREVVGVVGTILQQRIPLEGLMEPSVYLPLAQMPLRNPAIAVRTSGDPTALAGDVRAAVRAIDPDQPVTLLQTMDEAIAYELAAPRFLNMFLLGLIALALFLSAMGIYGVISHGVLQERREIGIRMALGARGGQVVGRVTRKGMVLAAVGLAVGAPLAFLVHRGVLLSLNLFGAELGPSTGFLAALVLAGVAAVATFLPARNASKVEPTRALSLE